MLHQNYFQQLLDVMVVEVNEHEDRGPWILIKQKDAPTDHYMNGRISTILEFWSFKCKIFTDGRLLKQKTRLCDHGGMQKLEINYWKTIIQW